MLKPISLSKNPSFENIISILCDINKNIKKEDLIQYFKDIIFDFSEMQIPLFSACFDKANPHAFDFLRNPVKGNGKYFSSKNEQECLVTYFSLNVQEVYSYIEKMDSFISDKKDSAIKVLDEYNMDFAKQSIFELTTYHNNDFSENELCEIKNFFEYYIYLIENSKFNQAICMLMLYSLINVNIIYLKEYFQKKMEFNPIEEDEINAETEYVISSALNQNIFFTIENSDEPLHDNDKSGEKRPLLFAQTKNYLTYKNSVFTFEKIGTSHNDLTDDEEDNYGDKKFTLTKSGLPLGKVMNIVVPISNSIFGNLNFRNMKKYYIKSHNGLYLTYNDWHTSTKLIFSTEKTNKSEWFIEMENNGNVTFTPAGSKQYTWFAIDVPNATQKTNKIPMWIFVKNDSKAQKFKLHKVIR